MQADDESDLLGEPNYAHRYFFFAGCKILKMFCLFQYIISIVTSILLISIVMSKSTNNKNIFYSNLILMHVRDQINTCMKFVIVVVKKVSVMIMLNGKFLKDSNNSDGSHRIN